MLAQRNSANVRRLSGKLPEWREVITVDVYLSPNACRAKALDCMIKADTLVDDPVQQAAMLRYADWWNRLAEHYGSVAPPRPKPDARVP
jgi:hypothetical protein